MDKKSLLFGLGLGFIITSLVFYITLNFATVDAFNEVPSDNQVIQRAGELGMYFVVPENNVATEPTSKAALAVDDLSLEQTVAIDESEYIDFTIEDGMSALEIANAFEDVGIIENSETFLNEVIDMGSATKIRAGNYKIPIGIGYVQLVELITA